MAVWHWLKYVFLCLLLFAILNLFRSNMMTEVVVTYKIPWIWDAALPAVSINYLLLIVFCLGILFAAFLGAFRIGTIRDQKREIGILKKLIQEKSKTPDRVETRAVNVLPPLAE